MKRLINSLSIAVVLFTMIGCGETKKENEDLTVLKSSLIIETLKASEHYDFSTISKHLENIITDIKNIKGHEKEKEKMRIEHSRFIEEFEVNKCGFSKDINLFKGHKKLMLETIINEMGVFVESVKLTLK